MLGIQYSVRDAAGNVSTGTLSLTESSETIAVFGLEDISLNLPTSSVMGYLRQGDDLVMQLVGGKTIVLDGYFETPGKELLLSERGMMNQVVIEGDEQGALLTSYNDVDLTGKWSEYDQLAFLDLERVEPVVAPLLAPLAGLGALGAAGAVGVGAILLDGDDGGIGGGGGDTPDTTAPDLTITDGVESSGDVVNEEVYDSGTFPISGEGEPGAEIEVTVGTETIETTVGDDGSWTVEVPSTAIDEGEYETEVTVTTSDEAGNSTTVTETLVVDTEAENLTFDTVEGDNVVNAEEASDGITISGTSEAGATVVVEFEGNTVETTVGEDGTWSVDFASSEYATGTYESTVTATVTDWAGNSATYTHDIQVDTETSVTMNTSAAGGDGVVNEAEYGAGISLSGTGEAGSTVDVTIEGVTRSASVGEDGTWTVTFESGSLPAGTYTAEATAVVTDAAGNTASTTGSFDIDTAVGVAISSGHSGGDETVNQAESEQGMSFSGSADPGATVIVSLSGTSIETVADADGDWTVTYPAGTLAPGEYDTLLTAVATDAAGNSATSTSIVHVDTVAGDIALSSDPIEGDNVINAVEASDGVWVTGTATAGHTVEVTLGGVSHTVVATGSGTFSAFFGADEVASGEYDTTATATLYDTAGNSLTVETDVHVDTYVTDFAETEIQGGADGIVNAAEAASGLPLSGTVEAGSTVVVSYDGVDYNAFVDASGDWSVTIPTSALPDGEGSMTVVVNATDAAGNTASLSETITYDMLVTALDLTADAGGDHFINHEEANEGVVLTGVVEPGSTVFVTIEGVRREAVVDQNGDWTVTFEPGDVADGTYDTDVLIEATDAAGNTLSQTTTLTVDTEIDAPVIAALTRDTDGVRAVFTGDHPDDIAVHSISDDGSVTEVAHSTIDVGSETLLNFNDEVSNGEQIVISAEDDAGNDSDTLLVLDTTNARPDGVYFEVDIDNAGLDGFDLSAIDMQFVNGGEVTLSAGDLARLTGEDNTLTVHGGEDDRVVLEGAVATGATTTVEGESYNIYTLGDDHQVFIDSDIEVVMP